MTGKEHQLDPVPVNQLLKKLIEAGTAKNRVVALGGYIGPAPEGKVRIYPDLSTEEYIEAAREDVVYWRMKSEEPDFPAVIYFAQDAELTHVSRFPALDFEFPAHIMDNWKVPLDKECFDECVADKVRKCTTDALERGRQLDWDLDRTILEIIKCTTESVMAGFNNQCRSECSRSIFTLPEGAYRGPWRRVMGR